MKNSWFRFYHEALDDPKVQRLPAEDFKAWVNLLCIATRNDGKLPPVEDLIFALRETENGVITLIERLSNANLIERRNGGVNGYHYAPYQWEERQYKSDSSTERVQRFRKRNETLHETPPETETESESETEESTKVDSPPSPPKRRSRLPTDFKPILTDKAQAMVSGWPDKMLERQLSKFIDHHTAKGTTMIDWQAALRTWLTNADEWRGRNNGAGNSPRHADPNEPDSFGSPMVRAAARAVAAERDS